MRLLKKILSAAQSKVKKKKTKKKQKKDLLHVSEVDLHAQLLARVDTVTGLGGICKKFFNRLHFAGDRHIFEYVSISD